MDLLRSVRDLFQSERKLLYSADLDQATYNMPVDVISSNTEFLAELMQDNPLWDCYGELFAEHRREIDFSVLREEGYRVPETLTTNTGMFMGDALAFVHLSLLLASCVNYASCKGDREVLKAAQTGTPPGRPLGQSVGDDLLVLGVSRSWAKRADRFLAFVKAKTSKIHAVSKNGLFAEQYVFHLQGETFGDLPPGSLFGDLWFVDCIKPMLLIGQPKVSSEKRNSFIGHARALHHQMQWMPGRQAWKKLKAQVFLWLNNYEDAKRFGGTHAHLPIELGGLDIPLGGCQPEWSGFMRKEVIPYLTAIAEMEQSQFLKYDLLLRGVFRSAPKGVPWSNDPDRVEAVCNTAAIIPVREIEACLADKPFYERLSGIEKTRYLRKEFDVISADRLDDELSRRESFLEFWNSPKASRPFNTLTSAGAKERHESVWRHIKANVTPSLNCVQFCGPGGFKALADRFKLQTWGFFVYRSDPAIAGVFENVGSLTIPLREVTRTFDREVYRGASYR